MNLCSDTLRSSTKWLSLQRLSLPLSLILTACSGSDDAKPLVNGQNPYAGTDLSKAPNILLIVADDLGYSDIGVFGAEIPTPHIDSIAETGVTFTNFHVASSCAPTRSMLLTGVDNHLAGQGSMTFIASNQRGQPGYEDRLNERVVSVVRLLKDAGYHTYMAGKWHLGSKTGQRPADRGFERSFTLLGGAAAHFKDSFRPTPQFFLDHNETDIPEDFYSSDYYTDTVIDFISNSQSERPFFVYAAYTAPHWPLQAKEEDIARHLKRYEAGWDKIRSQRFKQMQSLGIIPTGLTIPKRWNNVPAWNSLDSTQRKTEAKKMAIYAAMIDNMDANIGRLLKHLKDSGKADNTVVIFMSDNGPDATDLANHDALIFKLMTLGADNSYNNMGKPGSIVTYGMPWANVSATPLQGFKGLATEGGVRVPLLISLPPQLTLKKTPSNHLTNHLAPDLLTDDRPKPEQATANSIVRDYVSVMDITPTLLDLAGIKPPGMKYRGRQVHLINGDSLYPLLTKKVDHIERKNTSAGFELFGHQAQFSGPWKILKQQPPFGNKQQWALYNILTDPSEENNLAKDHPLRMQTMIGQHKQFLLDKAVILPPEDYNALSGKIGLWELLIMITNK